jgi:serine O-acetyltransferase
MFFREEIRAVRERDPAARTNLEVILTTPGLHALAWHRVSSWLWRRRLKLIGRLVSNFGRFFTGIEIHPGARIGRGVFIDHGMGVVIGETAIVGDNCTLYQGVTLGGTGKERGKRHRRRRVADRGRLGRAARRAAAHHRRRRAGAGRRLARSDLRRNAPGVAPARSEPGCDHGAGAADRRTRSQSARSRPRARAGVLIGRRARPA